MSPNSTRCRARIPGNERPTTGDKHGLRLHPDSMLLLVRVTPQLARSSPEALSCLSSKRISTSAHRPPFLTSMDMAQPRAQKPSKSNGCGAQVHTASIPLRRLDR